MKKFTLFLLVLGALFTEVLAQKAPSIDVVDLNRNTVAFDSLVKKGQITVVSFWATWCGPCIKELQAIDDNKYEEWQDNYG
ncbi:MAG: TlpA family protein disulfide reductase, partial [Bacteroidia bacterium]